MGPAVFLIHGQLSGWGFRIWYGYRCLDLCGSVAVSRSFQNGWHHWESELAAHHWGSPVSALGAARRGSDVMFTFSPAAVVFLFEDVCFPQKGGCIVLEASVPW